MESIADLLTASGINLGGWTLTSARAVSADGLTIVGVGINPAGNEEVWIATLR